MTVDAASERAERLRRALEAGGARLDPEAVAHAQDALKRMDERFVHGTEHTVVALAGATGSGKSSMMNAIAGLKVARTGARRPTTSTPTSVQWGPGGEELLEWLGVSDQHRTTRESELDGDRYTDFGGLILVDFPDYDSTATEHRVLVDDLISQVDMLLWVVDPQKYADDLLHHGYLTQFVDHQDVMVVLLNQIDRLRDEDIPQVVGHLTTLLAEAGLEKVQVIATSTVTGEGIDDVMDVLRQKVLSQSAASDRTLADLRTVSTELTDSVGDGEPDLVDSSAAYRLVAALSDAAGVPAVADAVQRRYVKQAGMFVDWPFLVWLKSLPADPLKRLGLDPDHEDSAAVRRSSVPEPSHAARATVERSTAQLVSTAVSGMPMRWQHAVREQTLPGVDDLSDALDQAVVAQPLAITSRWWWWLVGAAQWLFALALVGGLGLIAADALMGVVGGSASLDTELLSLPLGTVLVLVGLLGGLLLTTAAKVITGAAARRHRQRIEAELYDRVAVVADEHIIGPVAGVLADHRQTRQALATV